MGCSVHLSILQHLVQSLRDACSKEMCLVNDFHITGLISVSSRDLSSASFIISEHAKPSKENAAELFWDGASFHAVSSLSLAPSLGYEMCACTCCICSYADQQHSPARVRTVVSTESNSNQVSEHQTQCSLHSALGCGSNGVKGDLQAAQTGSSAEACHVKLLMGNSLHHQLNVEEVAASQHFPSSDSPKSKEDGSLGVLIINMSSSCKDVMHGQDNKTVNGSMEFSSSRSEMASLPLPKVEALDDDHHLESFEPAVSEVNNISVHDQPLQEQNTHTPESAECNFVKSEFENDCGCSGNQLKQEAHYDTCGIGTTQIKIEPGDKHGKIAVSFEEREFSSVPALETLENIRSAFPKQEPCQSFEAGSSDVEEDSRRSTINRELHKVSMLSAVTVLSGAAKEAAKSGQDCFLTPVDNSSTFPVISSTVSLASIVSSQEQWEDQWSQVAETVKAHANSSPEHSFDSTGDEIHSDGMQSAPRSSAYVPSSFCQESVSSEGSKLPLYVSRYKEIRPKLTPDYTKQLSAVLGQNACKRSKILMVDKRRRKKSSKVSSRPVDISSYSGALGSTSVPVFQFSQLGVHQVNTSNSQSQGTVSSNVLAADTHNSGVENMSLSGTHSHYVVGVFPTESPQFSSRFTPSGILHQPPKKIRKKNANIPSAHGVDHLILSPDKGSGTVVFVNGMNTYPVETMISPGGIQVSQPTRVCTTESSSQAYDSGKAEVQQSGNIGVNGSQSKLSEESCGKNSFLQLQNSQNESLKKLKPILPKPPATDLSTQASNRLFTSSGISSSTNRNKYRQYNTEKRK